MSDGDRPVMSATARLTGAWWIFYLGLLVAFIGGAFLAPLLDRAGFHPAAKLMYLGYRVTCHQLPHHSWFIGGPSTNYSWDEVQPYTGLAPDQAALAFHRPLRVPALGYQLAFCERDAAIWSSLLLGSMVLIFLTRRRRIKALSLKFYGLAVLPMAIDGLTQLFGWRESTPLLRSLTGALFGLATAWLVVPLLDEGFREISPAPPEAMR